MRILLIAYGNDSYTHCFPHGPGYIGAILREACHNVLVCNQDQFHWPESHLKEYLAENEFDLICLSLFAGYYQYRRLLKISKTINSIPKRPIYILEYHGPSPEPEYFLKKSNADFIIYGEGEITIIELIDALENKRMYPK